MHIARSTLEDKLHAASGAECMNQADLRTNVRSVLPQNMVFNWLDAAAARFDNNKAAALACEKPVPPRIEEDLADMLVKSARYNGKIAWVPNTHRMQCKVKSFNGGRDRHVIFSELSQTPPSCCSFAELFDRNYPCYHGTAAIVEKHGANRLHLFIAPRNLTATWKSQYAGAVFAMPSTADLDSIVQTARNAVATGTATQAPAALPPPRGRPPKDAGTRRKGWYEQGPGAARTRRSYTCKLCGESGHTRGDCSLRQDVEPFEHDDDDDNTDDEDGDLEDDGGNFEGDPDLENGEFVKDFV
jgi:hypothetical protein